MKFFLLVSQLASAYPGWQLQTFPLTLTVQDPPFKQGLLEHSLMSMSTYCLSNCYDNATRQSKNNLRNSNVYPPRRGFFPTQACAFTVSVDANTYLSDIWLLRIQADSYKHIH